MKQGITKEINLNGYCDADWGGDKNDRKSTSGYLFTLNGTSISWNSKKQSSVALSTAEAEYVSLSVGISEGKWLNGIINELFGSIKINFIIFEDNQSCIKMTKNPINHGRSKHIDIKYHFIRNEIKKGIIKLKYLQSNEMIADILTKPLSAPTFLKLRNLLNIKEIVIEGEC